jgi:hypothetical protein
MTALVRAAAFIAVTAMSVPSTALAAKTKYPEQQQKWLYSDRCTKLAIEKYPDHTAEVNAKREAFARRCTNQYGAPGHSGK